MLDPTTLFAYERDVDSRSVQARTLLVTLGAFADSGDIQSMLEQHILATHEHRLVGTLDADQLIDYGAIRPQITLDADRLMGYEQPRIELLEVEEDSGPGFLLLRGPEPSFQWERTAAAIRIVVEQLGVTRTIMVSGFPTATPHTRPTPITTYAAEPSDVTVPAPMPGTIELRSAFPLLLTTRLAEAGHAAVGLAAHIPSYAHEVAYAPALLSMLTSIETEGGPTIEPTEELEQTAAEVRAKLDEAVADNQQLQLMVGEFEKNYTRLDGFRAQLPMSTRPIPGAEDLSDQVEDFLRQISDDDDDAPSTGPSL